MGIEPTTFHKYARLMMRSENHTPRLMFVSFAIERRSMWWSLPKRPSESWWKNRRFYDTSIWAIEGQGRFWCAAWDGKCVLRLIGGVESPVDGKCGGLVWRGNGLRIDTDRTGLRYRLPQVHSWQIVMLYAMSLTRRKQLVAYQETR